MKYTIELKIMNEDGSSVEPSNVEVIINDSKIKLESLEIKPEVIDEKRFIHLLDCSDDMLKWFKLWKYHGHDLNIKSKYGGVTPLIKASMWGQLESVKYLIDKNVNINLKDNDGNNALHQACMRYDNIDVINLLLNVEFDVK